MIWYLGIYPVLPFKLSADILSTTVLSMTGKRPFPPVIQGQATKKAKYASNSAQDLEPLDGAIPPRLSPTHYIDLTRDVILQNDSVDTQTKANSSHEGLTNGLDTLSLGESSLTANSGALSLDAETTRAVTISAATPGTTTPRATSPVPAYDTCFGLVL